MFSSLLARARQTPPGRVLTAYGQAQAGNYASGLAFRGFMTMFPLILGVLSITGLVVRDPATRDHIESAVASIFPADAHQQILEALGGVRKSAGPLSAISLIGLLWSGSSLFGGMEFALTEMFGTRQRDALRQRAMGMIMLVVFLVAVLVAVAANSAAAITPLGIGLGLVLGTAVLVGLLATIYRFVPNRTFSLAQVLPGALVAGIAVELFTLLFPLYATVMHGFNTYGQQFALFFLLATWLLFLSQFILLGAVVIRMRVGVPTEEGLIGSPAAESRGVTSPAESAGEQAGGDPAEDRVLTGRPQPIRSASADQTRRTLGVGAAATAVGLAIGLLSRRRG